MKHIFIALLFLVVFIMRYRLSGLIVFSKNLAEQPSGRNQL